MSQPTMRFIVIFMAASALLIIFHIPAMGTVHQVDVGNFFFSPEKTVVNPGDTVRWIFTAGTHTTTSEIGSPKAWDSGIIPASDSFDVVFTAGDGPGPFPYLCSVHPITMKDTIFMAVQPAESTLFEFRVCHTEANACMGTASNASGLAMAVLNGDSTELSFFIEHDADNPLDAHVHLGSICTNGAVVFGFDSPVSPIIQTWSLTPTDVSNLFAGDLYVNVHTSDFPAGEIRGQIEQEVFTCGDANNDGSINVGDAVWMINYVFKSGTRPRPDLVGDANCDGGLNVGDAVYLINYVFKSGAAPCANCP